MNNEYYKSVFGDDGSNVMVEGPAESEKMKSLVIPWVSSRIDANESFICVEGSDIILQDTFQKAKEMGYKTFILNLKTPNKSSDHWNPLGGMFQAYHSGDAGQKDWVLGNLLCIAQALIPYDENSRDLFVACAEALFMCAEKEDEITLGNIYRMIMNSEERIDFSGSALAEFFRLIVGQEENAYLKAASFLLCRDTETRSRILLEVIKALSFLFTDPSTKNLFAHNGFDIWDIKDTEKWAIYIILSDETRRFHHVATMFMKLLHHHLVRIADHNGGSLKKRFNFICCEFAEYKLPDVDMMLFGSARRDIRFFLSFQSHEKLLLRYGHDAAMVMKNSCPIQYRFPFPNSVTICKSDELSEREDQETMARTSVQLPELSEDEDMPDPVYDIIQVLEERKKRKRKEWEEKEEELLKEIEEQGIRMEEDGSVSRLICSKEKLDELKCEGEEPPTDEELDEMMSLIEDMDLSDMKEKLRENIKRMGDADGDNNNTDNSDQ
ncbi:MAG: type IV secretory system conjugative DNA transfer family protein [Clostridiales bacterium]|nr:type IV secretory system conjugative DNA transfer family protein [Clostridiales bacterium]